MHENLTRRELITRAGLTMALLTEGEIMSAEATPKTKEPFRYCLNTSTIRAQKLPLPEIVDLAAKAGYHAIEPWIDEIIAFQEKGGKLSDLKKQIQDHHLTVESAIGFAEWIVDDPARRKKGLEIMKRDMDLVAQIGGKRVAAPPMGLTDTEDRDLLKMAERYRTLCELGEQTGVVAQVEVWGFSKTLNRLGAAAMVAMESHHPQACILADVYHLYKGGTDHSAIRFLHGDVLHVLHVNDYPNLPRETITDADRVYPGDGVAPLDTFFRDLHAIGFKGYLSLELFNAEYYKQEPLHVIKTGLAKTRAAVQKAFK
jgi:sugar phosphate isomerase/epimerase